MWLATNGQGLGSFDGKKFKYYDQTNSGIPQCAVADMLIDIEGNKWIATLRGIVMAKEK